MSLLKWILGGMTILVALVIVGIFVFSSDLNNLVRSKVEEIGTSTVQTPVTLNKVDIGLTDAQGSLSGLTIANPQPYTSDYAFNLDSISVKLAPETLVDKVITIDELNIDGAKVIAEFKGIQSNLLALMDNLKSSTKTGAAPAAANTGNSMASNDEADFRVRIRQLNFINTSTRLITEKWGEKILTIPDIHIENIGGSDGIPPEQLSRALLRAVISNLNKGVQKEMKSLAKKELKSKIEDKISEKLGDDAKEALDKLKSVF